ncbi:hypothetical protein K6Y31_06055 [Motilimonas cestriensis]|uniref:Adhesin n=1 Tax=Motilimonas cestriensis TaxID=2742685 RepID=A0ABS8W739_9GAMM|nr:hypothetical protein [Motilimonas cestriensis]MCE2594373.1 hypothetical protein [Motilimonas cestriensis]
MKGKLSLSVKTLIMLAALPCSQVFAAIGANPIIDCTYSRYSDKFGLSNDELKLKFEIDPTGPTGFIIADNGSIKQVKLVYKGNGAAFIDETSTGEVLVTSIDRHLNSVHSSHRVSLQGSLFAKQYYGTCKSTKEWQ